MKRITEVTLCGFKGQDRTLELGARTVLTGPNGLGKSAVIDAVRYAISGEVPTGKSLDEVAKYFPERGGSVELHDEESSWIIRGIKCDHEKKKVSEEFAQSEGSEWSASRALLDMTGFLGLSPNKRREFVIDLVGGGETPPESEVEFVVSRAYARGIAGPAASRETLQPERLKDLPDDIRAIAEHWPNVWTVFGSYLDGKAKTGSEIFQKFVEVARERKNASRRGAQEAKAALRELEAAAKGAEASAGEIEKRREAEEEAAEAFRVAREQAAARNETSGALIAAEKERDTVAARVAFLDQAVAALEDPGPRPELETEESEEFDQLRRQADDAEDIANRVHRDILELETAQDELSIAKGCLESSTKEVNSICLEPIGRAVALAEELRRGSFNVDSPKMARLCELLAVVDELAKSWHVRKNVATEKLAGAGEHVGVRGDLVAELKKTTPSATEWDGLCRVAIDLNKKAIKITVARMKRLRQQKETLKTWEESTTRTAEIHAEAKSVKERYVAAVERHGELSTRFETMPEPDVESVEKAWRDAKRRLAGAEEAAGAISAYDDAIGRAKLNKVAEASWKAAEAACMSARESYVADIVEPIVDDIGRVLASAGRQERVYLRLENDRGKPIFDLGWLADDSRRSISSLSGGEAVLFTTALALALARRSGGRRVLLIEADPLDEKNLSELLTALAEIPDSLSACLVATSTEVQDRDGWKCIHYRVEEEAGVEIVTVENETPEQTAERILSTQAAEAAT